VSKTGKAKQHPAFVEPRLAFHDSTRLQFKTNTLKRHLSVEIEVDQVGNASDGAKLKSAVFGDAVTADGSLHGGFAHEVNTMPRNGDQFLKHIKEITDGYAELAAACSIDCGLHVHVNCSDLNFYDLRRVILLYAKVERALFELCADTRLHSQYSMPCGTEYRNMSPDPAIFRRQLLGTFYGDDNKLLPKKGQRDVPDAKRDKHHTNKRYRALNVHSYFMRKTLEFRHHEGSVDYNEITNWAMICGHVIDSAVRLAEAKITALPTNPFTALMAVLPENLQAHCRGKWGANLETTVNYSGAGKMRYGRAVNDGYWDIQHFLSGTLPTLEPKVPNNKAAADLLAGC
jgi:hypothetical protein